MSNKLPADKHLKQALAVSPSLLGSAESRLKDMKAHPNVYTLTIAHARLLEEFEAYKTEHPTEAESARRQKARDYAADLRLRQDPNSVVAGTIREAEIEPSSFLD